MSASATNADRNLLFGAVALLIAYLNNRRFAKACAARATSKHTILAELLIERS